MLRGPLVLQTFGAHWTAVAGAAKIDRVDDPNLPVGKPIGGLGLAAAAVGITNEYDIVLIHCPILGQACPHSHQRQHYYDQHY